ncbi:hypothetical protein QA612_13170 [Evansella sp. AB-P1]|uniref:hypothetical protein n=1 Tax=Evansella sp. AB-P1 TaxID=3037653 RepID=UPI00241FAAE8|nr:hypothetical protein [Evansella sp. AB-P1]MDG5788434.1 hypothetical protein [Evansella sp. AB-P1]
MKKDPNHPHEHEDRKYKEKVEKRLRRDEEAMPVDEIPIEEVKKELKEEKKKHATKKDSTTHDS